MYRFLIFCILVCFSVSGFALKSPDEISRPTSAKLKTYSEWKDLKLSEVESRIHLLKQKLKTELDSTFDSNDPNLSGNLRKTEASSMNDLINQIEDESETLSAINELTMADYIVGYLSKQKNSDEAIREISGRLKPDEVAELMRLLTKKVESGIPSSP